MNDFVVVSKANKDDKDYASAVVFNNSHKDADNEGEANAFLDEVKTQRPWQSHAVVSREDFDKAADPAPADPPADNVPQS